MTSEIQDALARLESDPTPSAVRFDDSAPLSGSVAVLPSAFNPPTLAHQHLLERALSAFGLGTAVALLTTRNVDKGIHGASLADRVGMLLSMSPDWPQLAVLASNQARIIDQAIALTTTFPGVELDFVVGFDTLERLFAPRYYQDMDAELAPFFQRHRVLAANRGAVEAAHVQEWIEANAGRFAERIQLLEIDEFPASLSSSHVRAALANGHDELHLPPTVRTYIETHNLYR